MKVLSSRLCPDPLSLWLWHVPVLCWHQRQDTDPCLVFFPPIFPFFPFFPPSGCWEGSREGLSRAVALSHYPASSILNATSIPRLLRMDLIGSHHLGRGQQGTQRHQWGSAPKDAPWPGSPLQTISKRCPRCVCSATPPALSPAG